MPATSRKNTLLPTAAVLMFLAVGLGAFGAHALKDTLAAANRTAVWQTAVNYHLVHGLALFAAGLLARARPEVLESDLFRWSGRLLVVGIALFSGSLYLICLGAPRWLGPVTPLGGLSMMAAWACLGIWSLKTHAQPVRAP